MKIILNPKKFINEFIKPIKELKPDGKVSIFYEDGYLYSIVHTVEKDYAHLYIKYVPLLIENPFEKININLSQLEKGLDCIKNEENVELEIKKESRELVYKSPTIKFSIKLLEESMMPSVNLMPKQADTVKFDTEFSICKSTMDDLMKARKFSDTSAFHTKIEEGRLYFVFCPMEQVNSHNDSISIFVTENNDVPQQNYSVELLDLIGNTKNDSILKFLKKGVFVVRIDTESTIQTYLFSPVKVSKN